MSSEIHRVEVEFAGHPLILEAGKLAGQANGALTVQYADTVVLATATMSDPRPGLDFFPLLVDFEEKMYAAGKLPGSRFVRREGRPSEQATLTARLTDHAIRPLFPKGALNDVQVVLTTLSADPEYYPDIAGLIGASAALHISDIPFAGPIATVRVGWLDGDLVVNPSREQSEQCELEMVVSGRGENVVMIECEGHEVPEEVLVEGMQLALKEGEKICEAQEKLRKLAGKEKVQMVMGELSEEMVAAVSKAASTKLKKAVSLTEKADRDAALNTLRDQVLTALGGKFPEQEDALREAFNKVSDKIVRKRIVEENKRPDGRGLKEVRPLSCEVGLLPRPHGSALFQRGETQALCTTTLATLSDGKIIDALGPEEVKRYLHHYNFPPFSTGETKPMRSPGRREIGHGALAEKALRPVLPSEEDFPYSIRVVSDIMSSNGSTSMAATCGSTLALMDAGVPIEAPVAGISVGLVTDENDQDKYVLLTDIQGLEDFCGDMDFKVTGTREGVTAIQLDQKRQGIPIAILAEALEQAREARLDILDVMEETLEEPREGLSRYAPKIFTVQIPPDKIGMVIGPGGKTIRQIQEDTGTKIDIEEDGTVYIATSDQEQGEAAALIVRNMTREPEVGEEFTGKVVRILGIGAFVEILPGKDGLIHISELEWHHVDRVEDVLDVGDEVRVKVIEVDSQGRINLSRKQCLPRPEGAPEGGRDRGPRDRGGRRDRDRDRGRGRDRDRGRGRDRDRGRDARRSRDRGPDVVETDQGEAPAGNRREPGSADNGEDGDGRGGRRNRVGRNGRDRGDRGDRGNRGDRRERPARPRSATARRATGKSSKKNDAQPKSQTPDDKKPVIDHTQTAVRPGDHLVSKRPLVRPWGGGPSAPSAPRNPQVRSRSRRGER